MTYQANLTAELDALWRLRLEQRWSYDELARRIEASSGVRLSKSLLSKWRRGQTRPTELSWYPVQRFLAEQAQECPR